MVVRWVLPFALTTGVTTLGATTLPFFEGFKIPEIFDGAPGITGIRFLTPVGSLAIGVMTGAGFKAGLVTGSSDGPSEGASSATGFTTTISGSSEIKTVTDPFDVAVPIIVTTPPTIA